MSKKADNSCHSCQDVSLHFMSVDMSNMKET